jgi:hypothetical protein
MDRQPPTNPGVDPQKKNAPADVAASREQVSSGKPSTSKKMKRSETKVNELRAVASGELGLGDREIGVDHVFDPETGQTLRMIRIGSIFEGFASSSKNGNSSRSLARFCNDFAVSPVRPRRYSLKGHGSYAHGITSDEMKTLVTATVDRALSGKVHPKQRAQVAAFRAIERALIGEAIDTLIDRACGVLKTSAEEWERINARIVSELTDARGRVAIEAARAERAERELAAVAESSELARARVTELEQLLKDLEILSMRDGTVGQEWAEGNVSAIIERAVALRLGTDKRRASQIRKSITNRVRNNLGFTRAGSKWSHYPTNPAAVSQLKQELEKELRDAYAARSAFNRSQKRKDGDEVQREFFFAVFGFGGAR